MPANLAMEMRRGHPRTATRAAFFASPGPRNSADDFPVDFVVIKMFFVEKFDRIRMAVEFLIRDLVREDLPQARHA